MTGLFRIFIPAGILGLVISDALVIVACYIGSIFLFMDVDTAQMYFQYEGGGARVAIAAGIPLIGLYLGDVYDRAGMRLSWQFLQYLSLVIGIGFLAQATLLSLQSDFEMPRRAMLSGSLAVLVLLPVWRWFYQKVSPHALEPEKLLFAGTHPLQFRLLEYLRTHDELSLRPLGFLVEQEGLATGAPVLGTLSGWQDALEGRTVDRVIVGLDERECTAAAKHALALQHAGFRTTAMTDSYELLFGRVSALDIPPEQLLFGFTFWPSPTAIAIQLAVSRLLAILLAIPILPAALVLALLIRLTSSGPVLVSRRCQGKDERVFSLYNFSSAGTLGGILRRTGFARVPALWNLIRGDIVLVGPRAARPEFAARISEFAPLFRHRTLLRPGITGWALVQGGDKLPDALAELEYDLYYMKYFSLQMDAIVLLRAFKRKLRAGG